MLQTNIQRVHVNNKYISTIMYTAFINVTIIVHYHSVVLTLSHNMNTIDVPD